MRKTFPVCCAAPSTAPKTNVSTMAKIPTHFGFWIADGGRHCSPHVFLLLGLRTEELNPLHVFSPNPKSKIINPKLSNYSSARDNTSGAIVTPICLAVFRLMTSSNFVGNSVGTSAGLAPFRILSTCTGMRLYVSSSLGP